MKNDKLNKHLTQEDRTNILEGLIKGLKLKDIAKSIRKDPTTVSKEIKLRRYSKPGNQYNRGGYGYLCANLETCEINNLCGSSCGNYRCKRCKSINCTLKCDNFVQKECKSITRFPFTCHSCSKKTTCRLDHYYYDPKLADSEYREKLKTSREGINLTENEFRIIDEAIKDGVERGLSIYVILKEHPEIVCSERTVYRYIEKRYLTIKSIDLRRKVTYKKRYKSKVKSEANKKDRINRLHSDFVKLMIDEPNILYWQLDLVEGLKTDKHYIMTLHLPITNFMLGFIIPNKKPESVAKVFNQLEEILGLEEFRRIFKVILTDRGSEFYKPENIELSHITGEQRTRLYYCDSYSSYQKAEIECNHKLIRYVIPKGRSIDSFTQDDLNLLFSHINSYPRESKYGRKPYDITAMIIGEETLKKIKISQIEYKDLNLTTSLI